MKRRSLAIVAALAAINLPFVGKPVHLDDANFLRLAEGARIDPWRPHAISINWQGRTETAFEVLSNPPGIGWWLAPVAMAPPWVQHLWMLPWLLLAAWGAFVLGERIGGEGRGDAAIVLLCGSPLAMLASQSLMPDLPLYACVLAGMGGLLRERGAGLTRRWPWALLVGLGALFRYSGVALIPLVMLWPLLHRRWGAALLLGAAAGLPFGLLLLHDLHAYGALHFVAMAGFQDVSDAGRDLSRKLVAAVAMLGGAGVLPILCWSRARRSLAGLVAGLLLGLLGASISEQQGVPLVATLLAAAAGGASLGGAWPRADREGLLLGAWLVGGLVFLLELRFMAGRYWLPFLAPVVLLPLREAGQPLRRLAMVATPLLGLLLAMDDARLAWAQQHLAREVLDLVEGEVGLVSGHWGWQHHLEKAGWAPLEEDAPVPPGTLLAVSSISWPQSAAPGACLEPVARLEERAHLPLPRVHSAAGGSNIHAYLVSSSPPVETYAPWSFGGDSLDVVTLWRGCTARD